MARAAESKVSRGGKGEAAMFRLDGHVALVTGSTQGVGAAIALCLARAGAGVILHGLREDQAARETMERCRAEGGMVHQITSDLSGPTPEAVAQVMEAVDRTGRSVTLLVNNAGTFREPPFLEMEYRDYQHTMRLNVDAGFFLTQAIARRWVAGGIRGRVLFTGSINGLLAEADHAAYDTSKGAVASMVRTLCVALAPRGIRVNGVAPGLVRTPLTDQILSVDHDAMRWMQLHTPNGQVPAAEVVGPAAVFLMSDEAEHVQGQMLLVDGGMSVWQQPDLPSSLRGRWS